MPKHVSRQGLLHKDEKENNNLQIYTHENGRNIEWTQPMGKIKKNTKRERGRESECKKIEKGEKAGKKIEKLRWKREGDRERL